MLDSLSITKAATSARWDGEALVVGILGCVAAFETNIQLSASPSNSMHCDCGCLLFFRRKLFAMQNSHGIRSHTSIHLMVEETKGRTRQAPTTVDLHEFQTRGLVWLATWAKSIRTVGVLTAVKLTMTAAARQQTRGLQQVETTHSHALTGGLVSRKIPRSHAYQRAARLPVTARSPVSCHSPTRVQIQLPDVMPFSAS